MKWISIVVGAALLAGPHLPAAAKPPSGPISGSATVPTDRAHTNYEAILRGEAVYFNLTPEERREIAELARRMRAQQPPDDRDAEERCRDAEYAKLGRAPSALDERVIATRCR